MGRFYRSAAEANMAGLNKLLSLALPYINQGLEPDVETLARNAGVDLGQAKELLKHTMGRISHLKKKR